MNCTICNKPIVLVPSAEERARKFGGKPSDYTKRFTEHSKCLLLKREEETKELIARIKEGAKNDCHHSTGMGKGTY